MADGADPTALAASREAPAPEAQALAAPRLLTLVRWLSPAYPTGAFAWSHGLEWAVCAGDVRDAGSLQAWLDVALRHGAGRSDAILLHAAHRGEDARALSALATALAPSRERRAEALAQGAAFARTLREAEGMDLPDLALPVALGLAARMAGLPAVPVAQVALLAWATHLVAAAQRLMPLGQTAAARVVAALAPACEAVAEEAEGLTTDDLGGLSPLLDVASLRHEAQEPRLFRS